MILMPSRADRLNDRFKLIQQALEELHGREIAFAAASAAWLMAIQYGAKSSMARIVQDPMSDARIAKEYFDELLSSLDAEHELMLRGFHRELCSFLGVRPADAEKHAKSFKQVIDDICNQGG